MKNYMHDIDILFVTFHSLPFFYAEMMKNYMHDIDILFVTFHSLPFFYADMMKNYMRNIYTHIICYIFIHYNQVLTNGQYVYVYKMLQLISTHYIIIIIVFSLIALSNQSKVNSRRAKK